MRVEDKEVIYLYCDVVDDCGALIGWQREFTFI